jgi:hypothetical protein
MKLFNLNRAVDASGVSGVGLIAEGVVFSGGQAVLHWVSERTVVGVSSLVIYDSMEDLVKVHGHNGNTTVEWLG